MLAPVKSCQRRYAPLAKALAIHFVSSVDAKETERLASFPNLTAAEESERFEPMLLPVVRGVELLHENINARVWPKRCLMTLEQRQDPIDFSLLIYLFLLELGRSDDFRSMERAFCT